MATLPMKIFNWKSSLIPLVWKPYFGSFIIFFLEKFSTNWQPSNFSVLNFTSSIRSNCKENLNDKYIY